MIFDSHSHYDDPKYENIEQTIAKIQQNGVKNVMNVAHSMNSLKDCYNLTKKYDMFYMSAGIHPCYTYDLDKNYLEEVEKYARKQKTKAIGEIGLDYFYKNTNKEKQIRAFKEQILLAKKLDMPVIIHCRDAYKDTLDILKGYDVRGVVHCFSGSKEIAKEFLNLGFYLSFTGVVTFKNAKNAVESLDITPMDKLLIETDCPYMSPEPVRGTLNDSSNIIYIAKKYVEIKKLTYSEILEKTYNNACTLFNIKK